MLFPSASRPAALALGLALAGCPHAAKPPVLVTVASSPPVPTVPSTPAPAPARSRVLLGDTRAGVVALACFDAARGLQPGSNCAAMPAGTVVAFSSGARVKLDEPQQVQCGESDTVESYGNYADALGAIGVTPPEARGELVAFPEGRAGPAVLGADERARVRRAILHASPKAPLDAIEVDQAVSIDIDRDGTPDRLYAVTVPVTDQDPPQYVISAVLACRADACDAAVTSSVLRLALLGAIDVDGDGWLEIVYRGHHYEGGVSGVARHAADGWEQLFSQGCGG